jgi:hypothetical protein
MNAEYDLWADENEPTAKYAYTTYRLSVPKPSEMKTSEVPFVYVEVDEYGVVSINTRYSVWFGEKFDQNFSASSHHLYNEIYEWLVEWDLAEWKKIGPDDKELFATAKLVGEEIYRGYGYDYGM